MPSAIPRWERANQPITARPLAPVALAPNMPATHQPATTSAIAGRQRGGQRAHRRAGQPDRDHHPLADAVGQHAPQANSVSTMPRLTAANTTPSCGSDSA